MNYVATLKVAGSDSFVEMRMSATGADYSAYRTGDTFMSYRLPVGSGAAPAAAGAPLISGKVYTTNGANKYITTTDFANIDTSFGPLNMILSDYP
jgi:hypothetical protein